MKRLQSLARRFWRRDDGNIAVLTALCMLPILGFSGLAVDYGTASLSRSRMSAEVETLSLIAARNAKTLAQEGTTNFDSINNWLRSEIRRKVSGANIDDFGVETRIQLDGIQVRAEVQWTGRRAATFGALFGQSAYDIGGRASASMPIKPFVDLLVLVDVSQSMGIPATREMQERQFEREGCMFACHLNATPHRSKIDPSKTTYEAARAASPPIDTRVDVARRGVLDIIAMAEKDNQETPGRVRVGVYAMSNSLREIVAVDQPVSTNADELRRIVQSQLILGREGGGSDLPEALTSLERRIVSVGDGLSKSRPKVAVILLSDGVVNSTIAQIRSDGQLSWGSDQPIANLPISALGSMQEPKGYEMGALDDRVCDSFKQRGVTMMVIETEYVIPTGRARMHDGAVDPRLPWLDEFGRLDRMSERMKACSSPGYFGMARDGSDIIRELNRMAEAAMRGDLRLVR